MSRNVRRLAAESIQEILVNNRFSTEVVNKNIGEIDNDLDQNFYRQLVYGTTENVKYIDYILGQASKVKIKKIEHFVLQNIRLAIYQLCFLETPSHAAINEAVKIVKKKKGYRAGNFVNGVLRNIDKNKEKYKKIDDKDYNNYLSIKYSYNRDLIDYLSQEFDRKDLESLLEAMNKTAPLSIRINDKKISLDEFIKILDSKSIDYSKSSLSENSLIIKNPIKITDWPEFKDGLFTIQDQSSILVGQVLSPKKDSKVLDICAAPGSKTSHLAQIMDNTGCLYANDISENKLSLIRENLDRMNFSNYKIMNFDAMDYQEDLQEEFDYILVDAPCSGLGIVRRKPDIKLNRTMDDIKELSNIQFKILENSYSYLKKGGYMVYSTCTYGKIENRDNVNRLLEAYPDLELVKIEGKNDMEIRTDVTGSDGFFMAKIYKHD